MKLLVKKLNDDAFIPTKAHDSDAGYDLYSPVDISLPRATPTKIPTGIALKLSDRLFSNHERYICGDCYEDIPTFCPNTVGLICDRSSMGAKGIKVMGGVVDSGYLGDVTVCLINLTDVTYEIKRGDKIAQILFMPVLNPTIKEVSELEETERGNKGFGSSGR
jgi:dUTP pyrophosphatase